MPASRIPLNDLRRHVEPLRDRLLQAVSRVVDRGHFVLGPEVAAFEKMFADACGARHCVGVGNGTDAIELALRSVGVSSGDEVILAANAGMYSATATIACGAHPLFADVLPDEATLDPSAVSALLDMGARPKAIVVTHLYGRVARVDALSEIARRHGIALIEDCAQSHGARLPDGRHAGSVGDAASFSFYPTKNLGALGDGGAVVCQADAVAERLRALRQYGWTSKYHAGVPNGRNSRLDEVQAAVLSELLPLLPAWNDRRAAIAAQYMEGIRNPRIALPPPARPGDVAHLFVVRCSARDALAQHLAEHGISSDVHYPVPDHLQPCMRTQSARVPLPVTERDAGQVLSLPLFPEMDDAEVDKVVQACNAF